MINGSRLTASAANYLRVQIYDKSDLVLNSDYNRGFSKPCRYWVWPTLLRNAGCIMLYVYKLSAVIQSVNLRSKHPFLLAHSGLRLTRYGLREVLTSLKDFFRSNCPCSGNLYFFYNIALMIS
ncbi:hypothetical protein RIR_jg37037.t1 [Rhizophagus irregularis DAOM 181602=DAOM 197198]|nr:hypothetical protein RIR_jg37037.t1 [Rhizophagus irregularis DAOM 181602=DAOM 197198]